MNNSDVADFFETKTSIATNEHIESEPLSDFDADEYRGYLDGLDVSEAQKEEFLRVMWRMMRCFVELNVPAENWGQIVDVFTKAATSDSVEVK